MPAKKPPSTKAKPKREKKAATALTKKDKSTVPAPARATFTSKNDMEGVFEVVQLPITVPIPYGMNARKIPQQAVDKVAASIKLVGFRVPINLDEENVIVTGHTRLLAAQKLGLTHVPCHYMRGISPEKIRAYRLADNRTAQESSWDNEMLALELAELAGLGLDLSDTGFNSDELGMFDGVELPELSDGEKEPFQQMTFTLHDSQAETVERAIKEAKKQGFAESEENENSNGNCLAAICAAFLGEI
jgi:ParB-like chromosome segregation protein Spo0J